MSGCKGLVEEIASHLRVRGFAAGMKQILYKSTNNSGHRVDFESALLRGLAPDYGLYMVERADIPRLDARTVQAMRDMSYARIAFEVLHPYLGAEIPEKDLTALLDDAYSEETIPTEVQRVTEETFIMWLTKGPTYSFKDYAARFFARALNYFLKRRGLRRAVVVATSGDTGGAVADALWGLESVDNIVFFPKGSISEGQRRQMTTLGGNVYAFEVTVISTSARPSRRASSGTGRSARRSSAQGTGFTSANSISLGRLLPQAVYPFFAYSRTVADGGPWSRASLRATSGT